MAFAQRRRAPERRAIPDRDFASVALRVGVVPPLVAKPDSASTPFTNPRLANVWRLHRNRHEGVHSHVGRPLLYPATRRSNQDLLTLAIISGGGATLPTTTSPSPNETRPGGTQPNPNLLPHLDHCPSSLGSGSVGPLSVCDFRSSEHHSSSCAAANAFIFFCFANSGQFAWVWPFPSQK